MSPATPIITLGEPLIELSSTDSTNIYAISQVQQQMAVSGSCYRADFQTHGKGQMGKSWGSEKGENLLCSYVLGLSSLNMTEKMDSKWSPNHQFGLSIAVSLAVTDFFEAFAGEETSIKWPNDLYWRDRKAGGILIENTLRGTEWTWAVIGTGININQSLFSKELNNPVSLKQITGKTFELPLLLQDLSAFLTQRVNEWLKGEFEAMLKEYNNRLYKRGELVKFKHNQIVFTGKVIGVNGLGQLIVDHGIEQTYNFGEITWEI